MGISKYPQITKKFGFVETSSFADTRVEEFRRTVSEASKAVVVPEARARGALGALRVFPSHRGDALVESARSARGERPPVAARVTRFPRRHENVARDGTFPQHARLRVRR